LALTQQRQHQQRSPFSQLARRPRLFWHLVSALWPSVKERAPL